MLWSHRERAERSEPTLRLWCGTLAAGEAVVIGASPERKEVGLINCYNHYTMKLTEAQRVQIFCSALNAHIQADATAKAASGSNIGSGMGVLSAVERASSTAAEAITTLQSKAWA